ncbi:MAG: hypothetical protein HDR24_05655 [Lachnospiraceae bacterium]|nr:hypothetical protein [Lachnospiraceae bacterium]
MIELFEKNVKLDERQSSKGNQLKWENNGTWYKADYTGYEGLAEYVVSGLLSDSSLLEEEYVFYQTEVISYKHSQYFACKSRNFLQEGWKLITLERLFQSMYGQSLNKSIYSIRDHAGRVRFLVEQTVRMTGLKEFGAYLSKLLTIDALFLNEDRHTHNIAVLLDDMGEYHYCPFFDHGAALLSDTTMDYPMAGEVSELIDEARAKTFCQDFDEQLDIVEELYGQHIHFFYNSETVDKLLREEPFYPEEIKNRVKMILMNQRRKYSYLFSSSAKLLSNK